MSVFSASYFLYTNHNNNSPSRGREWRINPFSAGREMSQDFPEKGRLCGSVGGDRHVQSGFLEEGDSGKGVSSTILEHTLMFSHLSGPQAPPITLPLLP